MNIAISSVFGDKEYEEVEMVDKYFGDVIIDNLFGEILLEAHKDAVFDKALELKESEEKAAGKN